MLKMGSLRGYYLTSSKGISITNMRLRELHFKLSLLRGKIDKLSLWLDYWGRYWIWGIMITTWILLICTHYQDPWNSRSMLRNSRKKKSERGQCGESGMLLDCRAGWYCAIATHVNDKEAHFTGRTVFPQPNWTKSQLLLYFVWVAFPLNWFME